MTRRATALFLFAVCLTAFCSTNILSIFASDADSWIVKTSMPTPRVGLGVAVVNGKIYVIGGFSTTAGVGMTHFDTTEEYDPITDTWTSKAPLPTLRTDFGIAVCQNKIYVIGGTYDGVATAVNEVYDPATDSWTTKASMPIARAYLDANTVNGKIYLIGGAYYPPYYGAFMDEYSETQVYDPLSDSWTTKAEMPIPTGDYTSAVIDNKIYIISGGGSPSSRTQIYDTITNTWTDGKPLPVAQRWAAAVATSGVYAPKRLYVIGGDSASDNGNGLNQIYDPQTGNWTFGTNMTTPRHGLAVAVVNDVLYALGGSYSGGLADNEAYFPSSYSVPEGQLSDVTSPAINLDKPQNTTYTTNTVSLNFAVDEEASWRGYSLDGQTNITLTTNTINLANLADGTHNLTVYATDMAGNTGTSETVFFTVEPDATEWILTAIVAITAVVASILIYYTKSRKQKH